MSIYDRNPYYDWETGKSLPPDALPIPNQKWIYRNKLLELFIKKYFTFKWENDIMRVYEGNGFRLAYYFTKSGYKYHNPGNWILTFYYWSIELFQFEDQTNKNVRKLIYKYLKFKLALKIMNK